MLPSPSAGLPTPSTAAGTKRPAASDLQRSAVFQATPSKRHATAKASSSSSPSVAVGGSMNTAPVAVGNAPVATMSTTSSSIPGGPAVTNVTQSPMPPVSMPMSMPIPMPMSVTEDQLLGRSPDQLMATILHIQSQHQQYAAAISAQYENISQQLNELKGSLAAFHSGQVAAHQVAASQLQVPIPAYPDPRASRSAAPGPPMLAQTIPPNSRASHPANRVGRPPPQSPQMTLPDSRLLPKQANMQTPQTPGPPSYDYRTVGTVEEVWKEYREGMDGQPAIEELDATWGSRWRPEPRGRTWYSRRKVIWDKIRDFINEGMTEEEAVRKVERLRDGGTINKLIRLLQDERKDKDGGDDSIGV